MEEIELQAILDYIQASLASAIEQPLTTTEDRARQIVSEIDELARESGGSAEFVSVVGGIVNYRLSLPQSVASGFVDEWAKLDAPLVRAD